MTKPCGRPAMIGVYQFECDRPRMKGKQRCVWHWLMSQPADVQASYAATRREKQLGHDFAEYQARVPATKWPEGERWCAGCQSFVPLFYATGSRCKACASKASHASRVESTYGITGEEYDALLRAQGGRCFICQRKPDKLRLAVDHDHKTGRVRGLLCANNEHGCNRAILGNLEGAHDGGLAAARRTLLYLTRPPYDRLQDGAGGLSWEQFCRAELQRIERAKVAQSPPTEPPPF
jgi:hypothetical protein